MATRQDVNAPLLGTIGAVGILLILIVIIGLQAWFHAEQNHEIARKFDNTPVAWLQSLKMEQEHRLQTGRWVNRDKGVVQIPIDQAMDLIVKEHGKLPR